MGNFAAAFAGLIGAASAALLNNVQSDQIKRIVNAILHDELWIRRTLTNKILSELVKVTHEKNQIERAVNDLLDNLTRREYEIAMLVGHGEK